MNPYHFLYYKIYSFLEAINSVLKNTIIEWSAMFFVTAFIGLNIFTIMIIMEIEFNIVLISNSPIGEITMGILLLVNYFIFNHKQRYKKIVKGYSKKYRSTGDILVLLYIVATVWLVFLYGSEMRELRMK